MRWWPLLVALCGCDLVFDVDVPEPLEDITFIQQFATQTKLSAVNTSTFVNQTLPGDLVVIGVDWTGDATVQTIVAGTGDEVTSVGAAVVQGSLHAQLYYVANVSPGAFVVTVELTAAVDDIEVYLTEYGGVATSDPLDGASASVGEVGAMSSGAARLTGTGDLIFAYGVDGHVNPGDGFTTRSTFNENLTQDMISPGPGLYIATATATSGWTLYMAAFRAAVQH